MKQNTKPKGLEDIITVNGKVNGNDTWSCNMIDQEIINDILIRRFKK